MKKTSIFAFLALCLTSLVAAAELPFIQDNYGSALAQAKQRKLPIFVECWAPW